MTKQSKLKKPISKLLSTALLLTTILSPTIINPQQSHAATGHTVGEIVQLKDLDIGDLVYDPTLSLAEGGQMKFEVVDKNYYNASGVRGTPSTANTPGYGIALLAQNLIPTDQMKDVGLKNGNMYFDKNNTSNNFNNSEISTYLNGTFLSKNFSEYTKGQMLNIPYHHTGSVTDSTKYDHKVSLPSATEMGASYVSIKDYDKGVRPFEKWKDRYTAKPGEEDKNRENDGSRTGAVEARAKTGGTHNYYWTRTPNSINSGVVWYVNSSGYVYYTDAINPIIGLAPLLNLKSDTRVKRVGQTLDNPAVYKIVPPHEKGDIVQLKDLPIGSILTDPNAPGTGSTIKWQTVAQNHYKTGYDDLNTTVKDHTTFLSKDVLEGREFDRDEEQTGYNRGNNVDSGKYGSSTWGPSTQGTGIGKSSELRTYLNLQFINNNLSYQMKQGLVPVTTKNGEYKGTNLTSTNYNPITTTDKILLPSAQEMGYTEGQPDSSGYAVNHDNSKTFGYFTAKANRIKAGTQNYYRLRTPSASYSQDVLVVYVDGTLNYYYARVANVGVAPLLNLESGMVAKRTSQSSAVGEQVTYELITPVTAPTTPTLTSSNINPTNKDVTITPTYSSDLTTTKQYKIGSGDTWISYTEPIVVSSNTTVYAREGYPDFNIWSLERQLIISNIDKVAPDKPIILPDTAEYTNQDVTVTISYPVDSEIKQYKVGTDEVWITYIEPITISSNTKIYARCIDAAGNISIEGTVEISNIDKDNPTFNVPKIPNWLNDQTTVNITDIADIGSGIKNKQYRIGEGTWIDYTEPIPITTEGIHEVQFRVTDQAKNETIKSIKVGIDKTAPNITLTK